MKLREQLILVSDEFGRARGIGRQRVSTIVLNRGSTLDLLAAGRSDLNTGTFERAMRWFSENWPEDAEWPAGVPRPEAEIDPQSSTAAAVNRAAAANSSSFPLPVEG